MNCSSEGDDSSPEGIFIARQPTEWLTKNNKKPSPSELITFKCPYTLRKTKQFRYKNKQWTIGDIASLRDSKFETIFYAQIMELLENDMCEKRAIIMWLAPNPNNRISDGLKNVNHNWFNPSAYIHVSIDHRLVPIECLTFVMTVPNLFEYKQRIGTNYLVDTQIISHHERYRESDEEEGPKSKSKVRRLYVK